MACKGVFEAFDVQPKYTSVNTTDIIRQIVDQISIAKTTGESVIEMQLNPENLGKLYINVTERNSEITARIAVSNETVKNALESQMAALRENLQDANIRVNDVEITIATHEFERNLEQNAGNENGRQCLPYVLRLTNPNNSRNKKNNARRQNRPQHQTYYHNKDEHH